VFPSGRGTVFFVFGFGLWYWAVGGNGVPLVLERGDGPDHFIFPLGSPVGGTEAGALSPLLDMLFCSALRPRKNCPPSLLPFFLAIWLQEMDRFGLGRRSNGLFPFFIGFCMNFPARLPGVLSFFLVGGSWESNGNLTFSPLEAVYLPWVRLAFWNPREKRCGPSWLGHFFEVLYKSGEVLP